MLPPCPTAKETLSDREGALSWKKAGRSAVPARAPARKGRFPETWGGRHTPFDLALLRRLSR